MEKSEAVCSIFFNYIFFLETGGMTVLLLPLVQSGSEQFQQSCCYSNYTKIGFTFSKDAKKADQSQTDRLVMKMFLSMKRCNKQQKIQRHWMNLGFGVFFDTFKSHSFQPSSR